MHDRWNGSRFAPGARQGWYESWFLRANHPTRPLAWWLRYTVFSPDGHPERAVGERWAVWSDGESGTVNAAKTVVPIATCSFDPLALGVRLGDARLGPGALSGSADGPAPIAWDLRYTGGGPPLALFRESWYTRGFPKAKPVTPVPHARFDGAVQVGADRHAIDGWIGCQAHNWGPRHTDHYAWGQVLGFDDHPEAALECSTARVKIAGVYTPFLSLAVLRLGGRTLAWNRWSDAARARARFTPPIDGHPAAWVLEARGAPGRLTVRVSAPASAFATLRYDNPPGGWKQCLNSKLAACEVALDGPDGRLTLRTANRAAFELLSDPERGAV